MTELETKARALCTFFRSRIGNNADDGKPFFNVGDCFKKDRCDLAPGPAEFRRLVEAVEALLPPPTDRWEVAFNGEDNLFIRDKMTTAYATSDLATFTEAVTAVEAVFVAGDDFRAYFYPAAGGRAYLLERSPAGWAVAFLPAHAAAPQAVAELGSGDRIVTRTSLTGAVWALRFAAGVGAE